MFLNCVIFPIYCQRNKAYKFHNSYKRGPHIIPNPGCEYMEFACSLCAFVGFLRESQCPPTVEKHVVTSICVPILPCDRQASYLYVLCFVRNIPGLVILKIF